MSAQKVVERHLLGDSGPRSLQTARFGGLEASWWTLGSVLPRLWERDCESLGPGGTWDPGSTRQAQWGSRGQHSTP